MALKDEFEYISKGGRVGLFLMDYCAIPQISDVRIVSISTQLVRGDSQLLDWWRRQAQIS